MSPLQPARLEFADDGTPWSAAYGDVYHSAHGGPEQARHVFLGGNDLPARWQNRERFIIVETGFGLGLNFLSTWQAWRTDPQACAQLHFVSFEKHPFNAADLAVAQQAWPEFAALAAELRSQWPMLTPGTHRLSLDHGKVTLTLIFGDAVSALRTVNLAADAFFLDGFSPARNPELWSPAICRAIARLAAPDATLATWSVAGAVRQALQDVEFDLEKRPGFAGKRHMLHGRFRSRRPNRYPAANTRQAIVIGAGIAGSTAAYRLAAGGWQVCVLEAAKHAAVGASSNLAGVMRPLPSADDNRLAQLTRAGFLATRALLAQLPDARWAACGVLHLAHDAEQEDLMRHTVAKLELPEALLTWVDRDAASELLGHPAPHGGWHFPAGGWVQPPSVCRAALAAFPERLSVQYGVTVDRIERVNECWRAYDPNGQLIAEAPHLVMASGIAAPHFAQFSWLPQVAARGQVTHLPAAQLPALKRVLCRHGYIAPAVDGVVLTGATLDLNDRDPAEHLADHQENLDRLALSLPGFLPDLAADTLSGRVGFRPMSPDRLPIVGPVPDPAAASSKHRLSNLPRQAGLWCVQGFGARGIVWSALMADLLFSRMENLPLPLANDQVDALDPGRFVLRKIKQASESA